MNDKWNQIAKSPEAAALLKLFLRIDDICDHEGDVKEFLPNLLHQLAQLLDVQSVAITINDKHIQQRVLSRYDRGRLQISNEQLSRIAQQAVTAGTLTLLVQSEENLANALIMPIIKHARVLGSFILANKSVGEFSDYDNMVVTLVEARMDDAIDEWLRSQEQRRISTENRVIKELDKIRDETTDQGEALDQMIATILDSLLAQIGFITLYDAEKDRHLPGGKVLRGRRPMSQADYKLVGDLIRKAKLEHKSVLQHKLANSEIDSVIIAPMFISGLFLGAVVLINKEQGSFDEEDQRLVESVAGIIDSFIFQEEKFKRLMMLVGREATRDVEEALVMQRPDTARGQRMEISMLFADIRDYSQITREMDPTTIVRMLNDYFNALTPIVAGHDGIVDKYVGDELVALFTKNTAQGTHQMLAVETALEIQAELDRLNKEWEITGRPIVSVGVGIHTGEVVLGQIGSFERKDYTAIGANMNFAARLQGLAKPNQIIISEATYVGLTGKIMARRVGPFDIKGFGDTLAYLVEGRSPDQL
jgi:class 3 adenylate cyclase/GAF domain-containing protein